MNGKPVVEIDIDGLDDTVVREAQELIAQLGGEPRAYCDDDMALVEVLAFVVVVVTPLKPFLEGMMQRAGEGLGERLLTLLGFGVAPEPPHPAPVPPTHQDSAKAVLDGERGHLFIFRNDAPAQTVLNEALRALASLDTTPFPNHTQWIWDNSLARWAALPSAHI
ncbi:hypothetical protein [Embleya sp. NPDC001921]